MLEVRVTKSYRDNENLVVEAEIVEVDGKKEDTLLTRRFAYELDVDKKLVAKEMKKFLTTYKSDLEIGKLSEALELKNSEADETIASLESLTITDEKE